MGGATLTKEEAEALESLYPVVEKDLSDAGKEVIKQSGFYCTDDPYSDYAMPLVKKQGCAYLFYDGKTALCSFQKAFNKGKISFRKPFSCHIYPIKISNKNVISYSRWNKCKAAIENGKKKNVRVFEFLKDALVFKFGIDFYEKLCVLKDKKPELLENLKRERDLSLKRQKTLF